MQIPQMTSKFVRIQILRMMWVHLHIFKLKQYLVVRCEMLCLNMSQPGISVICHLKAYLIIWSVSIFWTTCHFFLSLGSNEFHRWQIDIKVCWVCIPVDYVTGRSEREWMQEWRTVPPPLELASSPSLTHTSHIPNISGLKYYLHNAVGSFFGYQHKADKEMMTSSWSHNWEKGNARARETQLKLWGHNDFSMYLLNTTKTWKLLLSRPIVMTFPWLLRLW